MRRLGKKRLKFLREQRGFTLIEVVVAVGILGLIGTGVVAAIDTNSRASRTMDEQVVAINLATTYFEALKECEYAEEYPNIDCNLHSIAVPPGYQVNIYTQFSSDGESWSDNYTDETLQKIIISVSRAGSGKPVLSICNFRTKF